MSYETLVCAVVILGVRVQTLQRWPIFLLCGVMFYSDRKAVAIVSNILFCHSP